MTEDDKALVELLDLISTLPRCPVEIPQAARRIEQLTAEVRECHENINLKADFIDAKINQLAEADEKIEQLTAEVERLRDVLCDACDYIRGHIVGPAQRDGILREARAALEDKQ